MDTAQVVSSVIAAWETSSSPDAVPGSGEMPPDPNVLATLIAVSFEASLLREENRPLTFRLIVQSPDRLPEADGPPEGLHRIVFDEARPFNAQELRRLTPAVDHDRSLVGVRVDRGAPQVWGIAQSGRRWLEQFNGGFGDVSALPDCLIIDVDDPGSMVISRGSRPLCALEGGALRADRLNVFQSEWLAARFAGFRDELLQLHADARVRGGAGWAEIEPGFTRMIAQQMLQRLISTVQRSRHGGTLLVVPSGRAQELAGPNDWVRLKYRFKAEEPRARFRALLVRAMNTLAACGAYPRDTRPTVGWDDYRHAAGKEFGDLDEAIFEFSHMLATLTAVDGVVVITKRFELIGFGGEIAGSLAEVPFVARALDSEGTEYQSEPTEDVGTRHRSVYRLCNVLRDILGIVVSQDGGARFVRWNDPLVTYWNHGTIAPPALV